MHQQPSQYGGISLQAFRHARKRTSTTGRETESIFAPRRGLQGTVCNPTANLRT